MSKPIVVFDTNIFISSVFWEGKSFILVKKALDQELMVYISKDIIDEMKEVLARDFTLAKQEI